MYHWNNACRESNYPDILRLSNFSGNGPAQVGANRGLGNFGTYDTAGNLKEWCWNEFEGRRYILGGAWNEPEYQFVDPDARQPFERAATFGFRCVKYPAPLPKALAEPLPSAVFSPPGRRNEKPADDQAYAIYLSLHSYGKADLKAVVESVDDKSSQYWKKERITFQAAYGDERVIADLYLPKNAAPPLQTILYMSGIDSFYFKNLIGISFRFIEFFISSGRAVMVPHYENTLERGPMPETTGRPDLFREIALRWSKDLGRSIDYLETRPEIDAGKLAFCGVSFGAYEGPRMVAVEPRIKVAVFAAGGALDLKPAEVDPWNFAPRVRIPVLMLNGRSDFSFPLETSQKPLFKLLGTPEKDKRHKLYEGGHDIFGRMDFYRDVFDWLDRYLGPVKTKP